MKRIQRIVMVSCPDCGGSGYGHNPDGTRKTCTKCMGIGEIEKLVNEIVHEDNEVHPLKA